ncbi:choice-of-anchor tandem repeat GloVer-containing protein [Flammeovirga kamogawensis]|uniref:T9SS type A sorting domain-containing protein n=1 Tax=Flammeovirga kamogawensis TaxID=373891 RepID=A0ABX8GUY1_9BACT|nr:choice-of-anchor tandem repeat GloVer-containing protein [Flammeovirga kamogawensis]MBB6459722.1 putative repeat protein (TIGR03803 family) [Flammeovirga kamogawensis]QWG07219.1 T9SS type A sorting domain-containing protein [Flammeovirga kamogawensis]TRX69039.1 T9SS type A sorting domain-containing protein [Flammeovirga kamogawensis]
MKFNYNHFKANHTRLIVLVLLVLCALTAEAQPYLMNTNSSGGIQNAGGVSIYNLSSPAGTPPEFYDHGESFTGRPGDFSSLVLASDGYIYGHTEQGGEHDSGIFFRIDPATNTVTQLFSFDYNNHYPIYNMVEHNQILYGIMRSRSHEDIGFAIKLSDPTHLIPLINFTDRLKVRRMGGGFYKLNNKLYATIFDGESGSSISVGGVLEYNLTTGDAKILCSNPYGFEYASGALSHRNVQGRDRLIVANSASQYGAGGFYEVDAESGFIHEISVVKDRSFKGSKFSGVFRNTSGDFYSRSFADGSAGVGTLVSILPDDKKVTKEFTFTNANGTAITGLVPNGHDLIGMTQPATFTSTGPDRGVIYQIDRHGNYKELYHFKDMSYPSEYFIITNDNGGTVWGIAEFGGRSDQGAIFKYEIATNKMEVIASFGSDTGFIPETRLTPFKDGKYTFSNRDGGIQNYGTLATFDPSTGSIGHLYSTGNNSLAKQGYSNGAFLASNGKYYAIERTGATAYNIKVDSLFYRDRLVEFNDDLDSVTVLTGRLSNRLYEANEKAPYNIIGEIIEIQGKLVFTYTNSIYTYDLTTGQTTKFFDLITKRHADNSDAAWDWGYLFSTAVTKKDDNTYYYATQGSGENLPDTHGGTIIKLDVSTSPWTITHMYTIDPLASTNGYRSRIAVRASGKGGVGVKGRMIILPGANSDPDTLIMASEYNSPTTLGCILAYPMGENGNRIGTAHIIKEFPETGFNPDLNSSANDSTDGWFPMADLAYYNNKIFGFTKGENIGSYTSNTDHGKERGTPAFNGTFWSIDRANANAFELLYTLEESTGVNPLLTSTDIFQLQPITGNKLNTDTLGCAISMRTFKVYGYKRGVLEWSSSNPNVTLVASKTNADSATFDFSSVASNLPHTTTISVKAYNGNASTDYQYGDTLEWNVHQYVTPTLGNIVSSQDLHCPTSHTRLTLSNYAHVDSFYWELPADIALLTSNNKEEIQINLSNESFGTHRIVCHAFNGCGNEVTDTLTFNLYDPAIAPNITTGSSEVCIGTTETYTATAVNSTGKYRWELPTSFSISSNDHEAASIDIDFSGALEGTYPIYASMITSCGLTPKDTMFVHVSNTPKINELVQSRQLTCTDNIVTLKVDHLFASSFNWTIPSDVIVVSGNNTDLITLDMSDVTTASVNVSVNAGNVCQGVSVTKAITITVPTVPTISGIDVSEDIITVADTVTLTAQNAVGGTSYSWNIPSGASVIGASDQEVIRFTVRDVDLGDHVVSVQATNSCGASAQTTATIRVENSPNALENELAKNVLAYPNPSNGKVSLKGIPETEINMVIRNIKGQVIKTYKGTPTDVNLKKLTNGQYFVDLYTNSKDYGIHKIIIKK